MSQLFSALAPIFGLLALFMALVFLAKYIIHRFLDHK